MEFGFYHPKFKEVTWFWTQPFIIIIVIIVWFVLCWTLPFIWACSRLDDSALDDRRLSDQCWVVLDRILESWSGARCDAVSPTGGSSPLAKGPHRPWARLWSIDGSARAMWPKNLRRVVWMMCASGGWSVLREIYRACTIVLISVDLHHPVQRHDWGPDSSKLGHQTLTTPITG